MPHTRPGSNSSPATAPVGRPLVSTGLVPDSPVHQAALAFYRLPSPRRLLSSAGPTLVAFVIGAIGTVVGTTVAFWLVGPRLGPDGYKVAASLCASYIGGSVNFAAVSQAVGLAPGPVLAGAMTADNCVMAVRRRDEGCCVMAVRRVWLEWALGHVAAGRSVMDMHHATNGPAAPNCPMLGCPCTRPASVQLYIARIMSIPAEGKKPAAAQHGSASGPGGSIPTPVTGESLALSMAAAALACTLGNHLAAAAGVASSGLAVMAVLSSGLAMLGSRLAAQFSRTKPQADSAAAAAAAQSPPIHSSEQPPQQGAAPFAGADALGGALMMLFFATIGAAAGSLQALRGSGWLVVFILLQLRCRQLVYLAVFPSPA